MKLICETERLYIREFTVADSQFIVKLLNEESFIRNINDKQVRTLGDAERYLVNGPIASYQSLGFGLNLVALKETGCPIGMCGFLKRPELDHPDLGYAFLPEFWGKGYAYEACYSVVKKSMPRHDLDTILAVTFTKNTASNGLLTKLGFELKGVIGLYGLQNNLYEYSHKKTDKLL